MRFFSLKAQQPILEMVNTFAQIVGMASRKTKRKRAGIMTSYVHFRHRHTFMHDRPAPETDKTSLCHIQTQVVLVTVRTLTPVQWRQSLHTVSWKQTDGVIRELGLKFNTPKNVGTTELGI